MNRFLGVVAAVVMLGGCERPKTCSKGVYSDGPILCYDRLSLGFGQEFESGTWLGTENTDTLLLWNGGLKRLVSTIQLADSGGGVFRAETVDAVLPEGNTTEFVADPGEFKLVKVTFKPNTADEHVGSIKIGELTFTLSGCGVNPETLASTCWSGKRP